MALGTIHVLSAGRPTTTLVMCPSQITHKWAREVLLTIPRACTFLIEDLRNGGDPAKPYGVCEVKLSKGKTIYEGKRLNLSEMCRLGRKEWWKRFRAAYQRSDRRTLEAARLLGIGKTTMYRKLREMKRAA